MVFSRRQMEFDNSKNEAGPAFIQSGSSRAQVSHKHALQAVVILKLSLNDELSLLARSA